MSTRTNLPLSGRDELAADQRTEKRIFWKGVLAVLVIVGIVLVRAWWWT